MYGNIRTLAQGILSSLSRWISKWDPYTLMTCWFYQYVFFAQFAERQKSPWYTHVLSKVRFRLWLEPSTHKKEVIGSSNMLANLSEFQRLKCGGNVPINRHFVVKVKVIYTNLRLISCHYCIAIN